MKLILSCMIIAAFSHCSYGQNDTISEGELVGYRGFSVGVLYGPFLLKVPGFGVRFTKYSPFKRSYEDDNLRIGELFVGAEYSHTPFSRNQRQEHVIQTFDSLVLLRKWENSNTFVTTSFGTVIRNKNAERMSLFALELSVNIAHHTERSSYGADYLYFDSVPSNSWFNQNSPPPTAFYGSRSTHYLIVGFGAALRFEAPVRIHSNWLNGKRQSLWYFGARVGFQNLGLAAVLKDEIHADPNSEYVKARDYLHSSFVFRLSIARGFKQR